MIGTIVNTATIITGSVIGAVIKRGINQRYSQALFTALGLCTLAIGANTCVKHFAHSEYPILFILSMAVGGIIGTALNLNGRVQNLTQRLPGENLSKGLITAILLYCIGTLSMVGPINSALQNDHTYLFTNATLDFVTSMVLAATYGIGVICAAAVLFCWQGGIYLLALYAKDFLSDALITETSLVGGILLLSTGLGLLEVKDCKTLNLIPALFMPAVFFLLKDVVWPAVQALLGLA